MADRKEYMRELMRAKRANKEGSKECKSRGRVYAIQDESGYTKFGYTTGNPADRASALQVGNALRLECKAQIDSDDAFELEQFIHKYLREAGYGAQGEWFNPSIYMTTIMNAMLCGDIEEVRQCVMDAWMFSLHPDLPRDREIRTGSCKIYKDIEIKCPHGFSGFAHDCL